MSPSLKQKLPQYFYVEIVTWIIDHITADSVLPVLWENQTKSVGASATFTFSSSSKQRTKENNLKKQQKMWLC